ncbi:DUF241 domain-containing protein [Heracleum sosnowskyi]|uniref:DUF241 domain-containing protein n=1 Tax=Heracleum sosnowskyi TaxID=360622 RepID=A0AAD8MXE9_9APIA|nr:DUF241 domain-containing protein [Heracleum sosnowskyi]
MSAKLKIVANFRRSLSFPKQPSAKPPQRKKTFHVRSTSLPCRTHPLVSQLKYEISFLKISVSNPDNRTSAWICDCLSQVKSLHESLDDLLRLPQTRESLRERSAWIEKVLEDFLKFVDVYGIFQTLVLTLKHEHVAAQIAVRRRDDSKAALYIKSLKKMSKEMASLMSTLEDVGKSWVSEPTFSLMFESGDAEIEQIIKDVNEVTMMVSSALFGGISSSFLAKKTTWRGLRLPKKQVKMEESIQELEQIGVESLWCL